MKTLNRFVQITLLLQEGSLSLEVEWKNVIVLREKDIFIICAHTYKIIKLYFLTLSFLSLPPLFLSSPFT